MKKNRKAARPSSKLLEKIEQAERDLAVLKEEFKQVSAAVGRKDGKIRAA